MVERYSKLNELIDLFKIGKKEEALSKGITLAKRFNKDEYLFNTLGIFYRSLKKYKLALEFYGRSIRLNDQNPSFHNNKGNALRDMGHLEQAVESYKRAISLNKLDALYWVNLSRAYNDLRLYKKASEAAKKSISIADSCQAYNNLGLALENLKHKKAAQDAFKKALTINPKDSTVLNNLGKLYFGLGDYKKAQNLFEKALVIDPNLIETHYNLCEVFEKTNALSSLETSVSKALQKFGKKSILLLKKAQLEYSLGKFDHARATLTSINGKSLSSSKKVIFYETYGKSLDKLGNYQLAFDYFIKLNHLRSANNVETLNKGLNYINDIKLIKESLVAKDAVVWRPTKTEVSEYKPVFLIGFPRSGTTLLDNILSSHPLIQVVEERPLIENLKRMLFRPMTLKNLNSLTNNKINQLRDIYFSALRKNLIILPETKIIVDKFPLNIVHTPLILRVFPEAKFIFSLRHPCDCILSCFMQNFKINIAMSNFLSLKTSAILYDEVMTLWESCEQIFSPERIYIKYEDVVNDLKYGVQPALRFLDLDWDPNLLNYQQTALSKGFIKTPSYNQVVQKLTNQPIGRWKNYHSHFTPFLPKLKVWLKKFEYEFDQ